MCQLAGHMTHIEGNPYLLFTVIPIEKKEGNEPEDTNDHIKLLNNWLKVRDYPHIRHTALKQQRDKNPDKWNDSNAFKTQKLHEEVEQRYCLVHNREYPNKPNKAPPSVTVSFGQALSLEDWRSEFKGPNFTAMLSFSDHCSC